MNWNPKIINNIDYNFKELIQIDWIDSFNESFNEFNCQMNVNKLKRMNGLKCDHEQHRFLLQLTNLLIHFIDSLARLIFSISFQVSLILKESESLIDPKLLEWIIALWIVSYCVKWKAEVYTCLFSTQLNS